MPKRASKQITVKAIENLRPPKTGRTEVADGSVGGLRLRVAASGEKSFILSYRVNGRLKRKTLGYFGSDLTLEKARAMANEALGKARRGEDPFPSTGHRPARSNTFEQLAERYIRRECSHLACGTGIESIIRRRLIPEWRDRAVDSFEKLDLTHVTDNLLDEGKPAAANRLHEVAIRIFNWADRRGELRGFPCPFTNMDKPANKVARDRFLTDDEIRQLWKTWGELVTPFGDFFRMLLVLGQRRSETAHMRWQDLDLDARTWTIPSEMTKSSREHLVPLSDLAIEILERVPRVEGSPWVFSGRTGKTPISGFSRLKKQCDERSGVTGYRLHDLRRTCATGMATACGISEFDIARVLNHARQGITSVYNRHEYLDEKCRALEAWARHLRTVISPPPADNVVSVSFDRSG
jgi:integrase